MIDTVLHMTVIRIAALLLLAFLLYSCGEQSATDNTVTKQLPSQSNEYIGSSQCIGCHEMAGDLWSGSHHDLAMQEATPETVLGDFENTTFNINGQKTRFFKEGERFMVETEDADGGTGTFEIKYTFGVTPLQQYLVEYGNGRLQALG
ncbi:MAG: cytochrome C, partial [Gammaproteobacteria bacterium]|nr:cytochrome C [Gammaproteobacteria bacterium]